MREPQVPIKIFAGSSTQSSTCQRLRPQTVHLFDKTNESCLEQDSCHKLTEDIKGEYGDGTHVAKDSQIDVGIVTADSESFPNPAQERNSNTDSNSEVLESRKRRERHELQKLALHNSARQRRNDENNKSCAAQVYLHARLLHLCHIYLTIITGRFSFSTSHQSDVSPDPASISFYLHFRNKAAQKYNVCIMDEETYGQFCEVGLPDLEHFLLVEASDILHLLAYESEIFFYDLLISTSKRIEGTSKCNLVKSGTGGNAGDFALISLESALLILVNLRVALVESDFALHESTDGLMRKCSEHIKGKKKQNNSGRLVIESF